MTTEEERGKDIVTKLDERKVLEDALRSLHNERHQFKKLLEHVHECLDQYYSDDGLNSGVVRGPDLTGWPDKDQLSNFFKNLHETNVKLRSVKHHLEQKYQIKS